MKNKELKFIQKEIIQNGKSIVYEDVEKVLKVSDIISQVINIADPKDGYGDLKEQKVRFAILDKCDTVKLNSDLKFSDEETIILKKCFSTFKPFVLSKDLITLQDTIINL